jgi:RNA polymerase sigma-70 factor (ECF subfamily)
VTASALPPLSRLYRESFDDVWATLRRLGVPTASLEDAVHDVFVVAHRRRDDFVDRGSARAWLLGIARRIAFRYRRTEARTLRRHRALATVPPEGIDAHEHVARREAWHALQRFLDALDRPQREAFVLGELQRLGRRELGAALGVSPNTAYSRLRAARARFSETFGQGPPSPGTVLATGRRAEAPPSEARQRVWLALGSGLGRAIRSTSSVATAAWSTKTVLTTVGLAGAVLGLVVAVAPGARSGSAVPTATVAVDVAATTSAGDEAPAVAIEAPAASPSVPPAPPVPPESGRRRAIAPAAASDASTSAAPADGLAVETSLLRTAQAALARNDAAAAIEALHEHQRRFTHGVLAEERDASIIRAECALGRHGQAREHGHRFVAAHPGSAYVGALADSCIAAVINPVRAGE